MSTPRRARAVLAVCGAVLALFEGGAPAAVEAGGGCRGFASTEATGTAVRMEGTCFVPTVLYAPAGSTVTWTNNSTEPHSVAGATIEWGDYSELRNGDTVQHTFEQAGTYPYYCFVHNGMIGAIVVGDGRGPGSAATNVASQPVLARSSDAPAEATTVVDTAAASSAAPGPSRWVFVLLGALGGLAAGGFIAGIRVARRQ